MRILHVIADLERARGGPAQACVEAAKAMARRGHDLRILTTERGLPVEYRTGLRGPDAGAGVAVEVFPLDRPRFWGTSRALGRRLPDAVAAADVVHLHSLYLFHDWAAGRACRRLGVPYIVRPHGTLDPFIHRRRRAAKRVLELWFQDRVLRDAAGLHYTTEEERELARPVARNPRGWVVANGIDLVPFDDLPPRDALQRRYPRIGGRRVVLFFGRLNFKKGLDVTIRAFAQVARERDDLFLVIAGPDDGMRRQAEAWLAEAGMADRALFTGMVEGEEKRAVLAGSDVFLLPSQSENFGIAVVEAAACGLPVIVSDKVNLWREVVAAGAGLAAPPEIAPFAVHLRALLADPAAAAEMGRRGAALVRARFTWDALAEQYESMYREAARRRAAGD